MRGPCASPTGEVGQDLPVDPEEHVVALDRVEHRHAVHERRDSHHPPVPVDQSVEATSWPSIHSSAGSRPRVVRTPGGELAGVIDPLGARGTDSRVGLGDHGIPDLAHERLGISQVVTIRPRATGIPADW